MIYVQEVCMGLPNYVHVHTVEEIIETNYVILNQLNVCENSENLNSSLLIAIKTAPANRYERDILRRTWLIDAKERQIPYIFVLGFTTDEKLFDELLKENRIHNDVLIGKPVDKYYNLTLKGFFLFNWARIYCSTQWLLYIDDDTLVDVQEAIDFVASVKNVSDHALYCNVINSPRVKRNPLSKFFVSSSVWKYHNYPDYCNGFGYLIPANVLLLLHEASIDNCTQPKLWIEDVFFTGIVTKAVGIKLIDSPFRNYVHNDLELVKKSFVLGDAGIWLELFNDWKRIRKSSTLRINMDPKNNISIDKIARLHRMGHLLLTKMKTSNKSCNFTMDEHYSSYINYPFYLNIAGVILIIIVIYKRLLRRILSRPITKYLSIDMAN